jgi:hypothetical protein
MGMKALFVKTPADKVRPDIKAVVDYLASPCEWDLKSETRRLAVINYVGKRLYDLFQDRMQKNHWLALLWTPMGKTLDAAMNDSLDEGFRETGTVSGRSVADLYPTFLLDRSVSSLLTCKGYLAKGKRDSVKVVHGAIGNRKYVALLSVLPKLMNKFLLFELYIIFAFLFFSYFYGA